MKCQICQKQTATITILHRGVGKDICKTCLEERRALDKKKGLENPSFEVRCCWKEVK